MSGIITVITHYFSFLMPIQSKYSNTEIESLISGFLLQLEQQQVSIDLSFMALGNTVTHLINHKIAPQHREAITNSFCHALKNSINTDNQKK